jgi:3-oxoadipate enol-lactonase
MRTEDINIDGRPVRFWRGGHGEPLILLQGGMADAALHWSPVWDALAARFDVVAPDWPGFGGSQGLPEATWPAMLDWLASFQAATVGGPAHLVGNSFGGTVARLYAADRLRAVRRLVIVNGGGLAPEATAAALRALPADDAVLEQAGRAAFSRAALARMVADQATLTDAFMAAAQSNPVILKILRQGLDGPPPGAVAPTQPTLVLWGEADRHAPPETGRAVACAIPGAAFSLVPCAGHLPQVENPAGFVAAVTAFLTAES